MVTVSFLKFPRKARWYAITQMGRAHKWLQAVKGVSFYKLMGSGAGNGFSIIPDLSTYCLLMIWDDEVNAKQFFEKSEEWLSYSGQSERTFTLFLETVKVMGEWGGQQPFKMSGTIGSDDRLVVLTRATIKKRFIPYFWSKVPAASAHVRDFSGHLFSKGVGEVPLLHQATVSVWKNKASMHEYAYQHDSHVNMIRETRKKGWYSEELFAEFRVLEVSGKIW